MFRVVKAHYAAIAVLGVTPLIAQSPPTESQFIDSVNTAINNLTSTLGPPQQPIIFAGVIRGSASVPQILDYIDGLKAAGAQRIEFDPGFNSIENSSVLAVYDAMVFHIRQLGLKLAINTFPTMNDFSSRPAFQDVQAAAVRNFPKLAARYHPDNFVVIHEPTTADGVLGGIQTTVADWHNFVMAVTPLIKAASPHTRVGAGAYHGTTTQALSDQEAQYFQDFADNIPTCSATNVSTGCLDFVTMDIYNDDTFDTYAQWAQMAHASGKGAYIEETWAPHYLPSPLVLTPAGYLAASLDQQAAVGAANPDFAQMDVNWIHAITRFAAANKMESVGPFTTQTFFSYGSANNDKVNDSTYVQNMFNAVQKGQLTPTGQAFLSDSQKLGIKQAVNISNASYPTLPTVFNPNCGSASNPCNPNAAVAADMLVSAFGADLATTTLLDGSFPTNLGGTTVTLVDASNTSLSAPIFSVSPTQVNYYVPASVQPGPVTVTVTSGDGTVTTGTVLVLPVAPGIYTANENGKGVPAAIAVCAGTCAGWPSAGHVNGQYFQTTFTPGCAPGNCEPQTINLGGPDDNVVLELYGTGWRHLASLGAITAQINGQTLPPVQYAGKSSYTGLDQLNVPLPRSLAGSGQVNLVLTVRDSVDNLTLTSNAVTLAF